jgi:hypothetical protein
MTVVVNPCPKQAVNLQSSITSLTVVLLVYSVYNFDQEVTIVRDLSFSL